MTEANKLFEFAELAEASYADFANLSPKAALTTSGSSFSSTQAEGFLNHWRIVYHQPDTTEGFSATLFQRIDTDPIGGFQAGQYVYAIRGTSEILIDLVGADANDIATDGLALDQIVDMYNDWERINAGSGQPYQAAVLDTDWGKTAIRGALLAGEVMAYDQLLASQGYIIDKPLGLVRKVAFDWSDTVFGANDPRSRGSVDINPLMLAGVTGHSLGGHLAAAFTRLFPGYAEALTINGAGYPTGLVNGIGSVAASNIANLFAALNGDTGFSSTTIHNLYGDRMPEFVTMDSILGLKQQGSSDALFIEQPTVLSNAFGHGAGQLTDSLAVYDLLIQLDRSLQTRPLGEALSRLKVYFESANHVASSSLESIVNGLALTLTHNRSIVEIDTRELLYASIKEMRASTIYQSLIGKVTLAAPALSISEARTDFGAFLSLVHLTPFALKPNDVSATTLLMNANPSNADLALRWLEDSSLTPEQISKGQANFSDLWLADRVAMLSWIMNRNLSDFSEILNLSTLDNTKPNSLFYDKDSDTTIRLGELLINDEERVQFIFGSDKTTQADALSGGNKNDHLYGMSGDDTISGNKGADHIEGGAGDDTLAGGEGNDTLLGGSDDDTLIGGYGTDNMQGGSGHDTYMYSKGDGFDTIIDSDGKGEIKWGTLTIQGDANVDPEKWKKLSESLWQDQQNNITYSLRPESDGSSTLYITHDSDTIKVKNWASGTLDITLGESGAPSAKQPDRIIVGDLAPVDFDPATEGVQTRTDDLGNIIVDPTAADPNLDDSLNDSSGNDLMQGKGGNDILDARRGGNDRLEGGAGSDILRGGAGADDLYATDFGNFQSVLDANDTQENFAERGDWLDGGADDDTLAGAEHQDVLSGGAGDDILLGGGGDDHLMGDAALVSITTDWSVERQVASSGGITAYTPVYHGAVVEQQSGDDILLGGGGNDWLSGGAGQDWMDGGAGEDVGFGGAGDDQMLGGDSNDTLSGDNLDNAVDPTNSLDGGLHGQDYILGEGGNDSLWGNGGNDTLYGGDGDDLLSGDDGITPVQHHGDDLLYGEAGNDRLFGDYGDDQLHGGADNDQIAGEEGNDTLSGGDGNDTLWGDNADGTRVSAGNDRLDGGAGDDLLVGGEGTDEISGDVGTDTLWGGDGGDILQGGADNDILWGDDGKVATELTGNDIMDGGGGDDRLMAEDGDDILRGSGGNDALWGMNGNDTLEGGAGRDYFEGGAGNDTYIFNAGDGIPVDNLIENLVDAEGSNTLQFGAGIASDGMRLWPSSIAGDYTLQYSTSEYVYLSAATFAAMGQYRFADDTLLSRQELMSRALYNPVNASSSDAGAEMIGSRSSDTLSASGSGASFWGGRGNDTLSGSGGNNTYYYNLGDGTDRIIDTSAELDDAGNPVLNRLVFGQGISPADLQLGVGSLKISVGAEVNDIIHIEGMNPDDVYAQHPIDLFEFADGSVLSYAQLLERGFDLHGTSGNDTLSGTNIADRLDGLQGNDTLAGKAGGDTYRFGRGGGSDMVADGDSTAGMGDILSISAEVTPADIRLRRSGNHLIVSIAGTVDSITLRDYLIGGANAVETLRFEADGTIWNLAAVKLMLLHGGDGADNLLGYDSDDWLDGNGGDDRLYGGAGNDTLTGGPGNDYLQGDAGDDRYLYASGDGQDILTDSGGGSDTLVLAADISPEQVAARRSGNHLILALINGSDRLTLTDYFLSTTGNNAIERIEFANGTVWNDAEFRAALLRGTEGSDTLTGFDTADSIDGLGGDDLLLGGAGDDTLIGGAGADRLYGQAGNDTLDGRAGSPVGLDALYGGPGDDIYKLGRDSGQVLVREEDFASNQLALADGVDTVLFDADIAPTDVTLNRDGDALVISLSGENGATIRLPDYFVQDGTGAKAIERIVFAADGSELAFDQVYRLVTQPTAGEDLLYGRMLTGDTLDGLAGNDTLFGLGGDDTLIGSTGDDMLNGGQGADIYIFAPGDGQDVISEPDADTTAADRLQLGLGITPADTVLSRMSNGDLLITIGQLGDRVLDTGHFLRLGNGLEQIAFADGTLWTAQDIAAMLPINGTAADDSLQGTAISDWIYGFDGPDTLYGNDGDDVMDGGSGTDTLHGGRGNDTLLGGSGDPARSYAGNYLHGEEGDDYLVGGGSNSGSQLYGGAGNDILDAGDGTEMIWLQDTAGNNLFLGRSQNDLIRAGSGNDLFIGGAGADSISTNYNNDPQDGRDIFLYNKGDGKDRVGTGNSGSSGADGTISIGGASYSDLKFSISDGIVTLDVGRGSTGIAFDPSNPNKNPVRYLQVVVDSAPAYDSASADPLYNKKIAVFDFVALAEAYLQAKASRQRWSMLDGLRNSLLWSSDTEALGGALAYQYASQSSIDGIGNDLRRGILNDVVYGISGQSITSESTDGANSFAMPAQTTAEKSRKNFDAFESQVPPTENVAAEQHANPASATPAAARRSRFSDIFSRHLIPSPFGATRELGDSVLRGSPIGQAMANFAVSRSIRNRVASKAEASTGGEAPALLAAAPPADWAYTEALLDFHLGSNDLEATGSDPMAPLSVSSSMSQSLSVMTTPTSPAQFQQAPPVSQGPALWQSSIGQG